MNLIRRIINTFLYQTAPLWPDELYLRLRFFCFFGYLPNLKNPNTFNEKLNWLKLHYHNPVMPILADKYAVKDYVTDKIGKDYVVPCYGVWEHFDDIEFNSLPKRFILKTTGDSGGTYVCHDKSNINLQKARDILERGIAKNYYYYGREWAYKEIKPRIIAEYLLDDNSGHELTDYKFWCFDGNPLIMYITNKGSTIYENFYDMDFKPMNINHGFPRKTPEFDKPVDFEEMKSLARKLSKDLPFVRVDFFDVDGKVYFGEYTFYDWGGLQPFLSKEDDLNVGQYLKLPNII